MSTVAVAAIGVHVSANTAPVESGVILQIAMKVACLSAFVHALLQSNWQTRFGRQDDRRQAVGAAEAVATRATRACRGVIRQRRQTRRSGERRNHAFQRRLSLSRLDLTRSVVGGFSRIDTGGGGGWVGASLVVVLAPTRACSTFHPRRERRRRRIDQVRSAGQGRTFGGRASNRARRVLGVTHLHHLKSLAEKRVAATCMLGPRSSLTLDRGVGDGRCRPADRCRSFSRAFFRYARADTPRVGRRMGGLGAAGGVRALLRSELRGREPQAGEARGSDSSVCTTLARLASPEPVLALLRLERNLSMGHRSRRRVQRGDDRAWMCRVSCCREGAWEVRSGPESWNGFESIAALRSAGRGFGGRAR